MNITSPHDLLRRFVHAVDQLDVVYFVTGSVASMQYGEPRTTLDLDVVVDMKLRHVEPFCELFKLPEYYLDEPAVRRATLNRTDFNILHPSSGLKIDVMVPPHDDFNLSRLSRIRRIPQNDGTVVPYASPEDVILKKMTYFKLGESDKHLRDIANVLKISGDEIDRAYILQWASTLDVLDVWRAILNRISPPH